MTEEKEQERKFLRLLEENKDKIMRLCFLYGKTEADRQDLFQEVLLQIWRSFPRFENRASFSTYLYRITLNVCMQHCLKGEKRRKRLVPMNGLEFIDMNRSNPQVMLQQREVLEALYHCIMRFGELDQSIVLLYLEDLSHEEIARVVGISRSNVGVRLHRLKKQLFTCLKEHRYE